MAGSTALPRNAIRPLNLLSPVTDAIDRRDALRRLSLALGSVLLAPVPLGALQGCRTGAPARSFAAMTPAQGALLSGLVDEIIPPTDTPGAAGAGVPEFVDLMLDKWYAPEQRDAFLAELDRVAARLEQPFAQMTPDARTAFATALDREAYGLQDAPPPPDEAPQPGYGTTMGQEENENEVAGLQGPLGEAQQADSAGVAASTPSPPKPAIPFFRQLKELTVAGYYTSEVGATQELQWTPAPGIFEPSVRLAPDARANAALPWK